jgi:methylisocitrate lyase
MKDLLEKDGIIVAPGVYNAFTAKIVEKMGFKMAYMSGSCTSTALMGFPDVGLLTMSEMVENAKRISSSVGIPIIADADTGYGNAINVMRTVKEYEQAGVCGIHIEDQVLPKKYRHMERKKLVTKDEMIGKIKAAIKARQNENFLIIARTDARGVLGLDEAIERANAFVEAGADMIFGEALQSMEELKIFSNSVNAPLFTDQTEQGKTPILKSSVLEELGYKIVVFSTAILRATFSATENILTEILKTGTQEGMLNKIATRDEVYKLADLEKFRNLEDEYWPNNSI